MQTLITRHLPLSYNGLTIVLLKYSLVISTQKCYNSYMIIYAIIIFILGIVFGSFLNAVIYRFYQEIPIWGRSFCPECKNQLAVIDLIPLGSYLILMGKCRYCRQKISWQYFFVELITGILFVLVFLNYMAFSWLLVRDLIFVLILIFVFVFDLKYYLILDKIVWPGLILALVINLFLGYWVVDLLYGILIGAGFFGLQHVLTKGRGVGLGDVKLGAMLGALLGWQMMLLTLMISYLIGGGVAAGLMVFKKKTIKDVLPMGTFLAVGAVVVLLWGKLILEFYWF